MRFGTIQLFFCLLPTDLPGKYSNYYAAGDLMVNLSITWIIMACLRSVSLLGAEIIKEIENCRCFGCEMRRAFNFGQTAKMRGVLRSLHCWVDAMDGAIY